MHIAVAAATGHIGRRVVAALERGGHSTALISRRHGVDLSTGRGLDAVMTGAEAVVDVTNAPPAAPDATVAHLTTMTRHLLRAGREAGVGHHVLLSILGVDRVEGNAHYAGKRAQEQAVVDGPVPWTIVRASQFHDFAAMVASWTEQDGAASLAPLLVQPIAPDDIAAFLADTAAGPPRRRRLDVAGPEPQDLVDMARRTHAVRGQHVRLVPTWSSVFGPEMAGDVLLPGPDAHLARTTFEEWLEHQR